MRGTTVRKDDSGRLDMNASCRFHDPNNATVDITCYGTTHIPAIERTVTLLPLPLYAQSIGLSYSAVNARVHEGKLEAIKSGDRLHVSV